jgi:hypothetical protein
MDTKAMAKDVIDWIIYFLKITLPIKLPGDIEITVWMLGLLMLSLLPIAYIWKKWPSKL